MAHYVSSKTDFPIIDLKQKKIAEFDYNHEYDLDDQFLPLIRQILEEYDTLVFASPVYWYSMSGIMKTFFDRISDLLTLEKDTGRKFRGKSMAVISCSSPDLVEGYYMPFRKSADYLGLEYKAEVHTWLTEGIIGNEVKNKLDHFILNLK